MRKSRAQFHHFHGVSAWHDGCSGPRMATQTSALSLAVVIALAAIGCGGRFQAYGGGALARVSIVRRGDMSGELALSGPIAAHYAAEDAMLAHCAGRVRFVSAEESQALAIVDPSDPTKTDDEASIDPSAERVYYVCVTREERWRRSR